ncbi:MAG: hypothetical protein JXA96_18155, partial [Sedimentisphaerales bacterium]|nr:hypothetical protein [Sedimentisphaerales bacterium]
MNRLIKKIFTVIVIALMISLTMTTMSRACLAVPCGTCRLVTSEITFNAAEPNEPDATPEMVPEGLMLNIMSEDPNDIPGDTPEMVPNVSWISVISEDPNDIPGDTPEMVP